MQLFSAESDSLPRSHYGALAHFVSVKFGAWCIFYVMVSLSWSNSALIMLWFSACVFWICVVSVDKELQVLEAISLLNTSQIPFPCNIFWYTCCCFFVFCLFFLWLQKDVKKSWIRHLSVKFANFSTKGNTFMITLFVYMHL